jgi:hypothetical protein
VSTLEITGKESLALREPESPRELMMLAIQGKADVAVLERLEAMQERYDKKRAKQAFDEALAAFQAEMPTVLKSADGAQGKYRFAPMDHILQIAQPFLKKHGLSWSVTNPVREGFVKCIVTIKHSAGHSEPSEFEVPIEVGKTRDGRDIMSPAQSYGSARTFCLRYAFCGALGILTADQDRDGQSARAKLPVWMQDRMDAQTKPAQAFKSGSAGGGGEARPIAEPVRATADPLKELWAACKPIRGTDKSWDAAVHWMASKKILKPGTVIAQLTADELREAYEKVSIELTTN